LCRNAASHVSCGRKLCFAIPPRQLGKEILQNKPLIYGVVEPDGAVSARVHIVHFRVELRCRPIIGFILCVCVENDTHFFGLIRNKEGVHRLLLVLKQGFVLFHRSSHAGDEIALKEEEYQHYWHNGNQNRSGKLVVLG